MRRHFFFRRPLKHTHLLYLRGYGYAYQGCLVTQRKVLLSYVRRYMAAAAAIYLALLANDFFSCAVKQQYYYYLNWSWSSVVLLVLFVLNWRTNVLSRYVSHSCTARKLVQKTSTTTTTTLIISWPLVVPTEVKTVLIQCCWCGLRARFIGRDLPKLYFK